MKKTYQKLATIALVLFGISFLLAKFSLFKEYNPDDLRSILVMLYLFTNLKYNMLENKDKDAEIQHLKLKLKQLDAT